MKSFFFEQKSGVKFQQKNNESQSAVFLLSALVIFRLQMLYNTHTSMHTLTSSDLVVYSKYSKSFLEISASTVEICTSAFFSLHIDCNDDFPLLHPLCCSSSHSWCSSWRWQVRDCGRCKVIRHRVCVTDIKVVGPNIKNVVNILFQFFSGMWTHCAHLAGCLVLLAWVVSFYRSVLTSLVPWPTLRSDF